MVRKTETTSNYWSVPETVDYIGGKPADYRVVERVSLIDNKPCKTALDHGCGAGRHTEFLAGLDFEHVLALDSAEPMLDAVRQRLELAQLEAPVSLLRASIFDLPLPDESVDAVISTGVLHQASTAAEYERAVAELSRVMRPGAVLAMNVFTNKTWDEFFRVNDPGEPQSIITRESLPMTLLSKHSIYRLLKRCSIILEDELSEETKLENTGVRTVLRANFLKKGL